MFLCNVSSAKNVVLQVNAKNNCFDLQKKSMLKTVSKSISNGKYQVKLTSNTGGSVLTFDKKGK